MRLFFAIELDKPARAHLEEIQRALRPAAQAKWIAPANLHLTLKFLGEVPDEQVPQICTAAGDLSTRRPFDLTAQHLLCFPPNGPIRIIGAGLTSPPELLDLVQRLESTCAELGFAPEQRPYRPHITLARARNPLPGAVRKQLSEASADFWPGPMMHVDRFVLMQSRLRPAGPEYTPAATFYI